ncbi:hypothetical protein IT575_14840 [bacterium]|nr:hypothetical protein [bacterium]
MQQHPPARGGSAWARPWQMLVAPVESWQQLAAQSSPWPALLAQWLLMVLYAALAARPLAELWEASGQGELIAAGSGAGRWIGILLLYLPLNVALAALAAVLARLALLLIAVRISFAQAFTWTAYSALPVYIGRCLGFIGFAIVQPLTREAQDVWALMFNPFSPGLAFLFPKLSFAWVVFSSFDIFGLATLLLLALGARHFLGLSLQRSLWATLVMVLLWLAGLTVVWRAMLAAPVL